MARASAAEIADIAARAGVDPRLVKVALANRPINADAYLRICAVTGIDPVSGVAGNPLRAPGTFSFSLLGASLRMKRMELKHDNRTGAKAAKLSIATLSRIENGRVVSIDAVLKACAYIGAHPFGSIETVANRPHEPFRPKASCETPLKPTEIKQHSVQR